MRKSEEQGITLEMMLGGSSYDPSDPEEVKKAAEIVRTMRTLSPKMQDRLMVLIREDQAERGEPLVCVRTAMVEHLVEVMLAQGRTLTAAALAYSWCDSVLKPLLVAAKKVRP